MNVKTTANDFAVWMKHVASMVKDRVYGYGRPDSKTYRQWFSDGVSSWSAAQRAMGGAG